jgi:hypothetical protein
MMSPVMVTCHSDKKYLWSFTDCESLG